MGSTAVNDCLDCAVEAARHYITEGFKCSTLGQNVPFISSGFYRNNISNAFSILKCIPSLACMASENKTLCVDGYSEDGCGSCKQDFNRNGSLCIACGTVV